MEEVVGYLVSVAVTIIMIILVLLGKKGYDVLKEKANGLFDQNRNSKVNELLALVLGNIDDAISAFFAEKNLSDVSEADITELLEDVKERVATLTGNGPITYLMTVFIDNWDEWLHEKILSRITNYTNK